MAKSVKGKFKCSKCDRTFSMAGHLARHMSATHGLKSAGKSRRKKAGFRRKAGAGRRGRPPGRSKGIAAKMQLNTLTVEELGQLIVAARDEARRKIADLSKALK